MPAARFDDLSGPHPAGLRLTGWVETLEAHSLSEVPAVVRAAEAASARGLWVAALIAYDAAPAFDPALAVRPRHPRDPFADLPLAWFAIFEGCARDPLPTADGVAIPSRQWTASVSEDRYAASVARIRALIAAGETYQVNYAIHLRATLGGDEGQQYEALARAQGGAYAAHLDLGRYRVLSASPELFLRTEGRRVTMRPMKGTAPRGRWAAEDEDRRAALLASEKERAENVMIVDLIRNDLGRVARTGTVTVPVLLAAERYETVWQLTSTVTAELRTDVGLLELLRATFPCGSVTGAPKVRTMGAIAEIEQAPRGIYTGAIGYLRPGGDAVLSVAIRTVVIDTETALAEYGVGGGITWDSSAASERREVAAKAAVLTHRRPAMELVETLRYERSEGFLLLPGHLRRLQASAGYFGFACDPDAVCRELDRAVAGRPGVWRVRLTLARDGRVQCAATRLAPSNPRPVAVVVDHEPVDPDDPLRYHKTSLRATYEAAARRHPNADDVLLLNPEGHLVESTVANVAVRLDGRWWTPPLEAGCLPGVLRAQLLADGRLTERSISTTDLDGADGLALLNSVRGWRPAALADRSAGGPGPPAP